jgi:hypothetical protein
VLKYVLCLNFFVLGLLVMLVQFLCFIDEKFLREKRKVIVCGLEN